MDLIRALPSIVIEGVRFWVKPPSRQRWEIDVGWEERDRLRREEQERLYRELHGDESANRRRAAVRGPARRLKTLHLVRAGRDGSDYRDCATVSIDLDRRRLFWDRTDGELFGHRHEGSGMIGVVLFSLPFLLPVSPFLWLWSQYYAAAEKEEGMSRHGLALLKGLGGQLDAETEAQLAETLRNEWRRHEELSREVSLLEAEEILGRCDLREEAVTDEVAAKYGDVGSRSLHWFDAEGDVVARASFYGERDHFVQVCGTTFIAEEADRLSGIFRTNVIVIACRDSPPDDAAE